MLNLYISELDRTYGLDSWCKTHGFNDTKKITHACVQCQVTKEQKGSTDLSLL
jgi:hypothetical protein